MGATLMADAFQKKPDAHASALAEHAERRIDARYTLNADTEVEEPLTQAKISGRTTDLGMGGCYVDTMTTFPSGTDVSVKIKRGGQTFEADARILYGRPGMGMGMAFIGVGQAEKALLELWIRELSGELEKPAKREAAAPDPMAEGIELIVLQQLITLLMRKGLLSQGEYEALRRDLERKPRNK